jgi:CRISPR-associated endonuclease/helicase Cas3
LPIWSTFWGKARPVSQARESWHPAAFHCLDVAAVAERLLAANPTRAQIIAQAGGWPVQDWSSAVVFLVALHDIGKFARAFQAMVPQQWPPALGKITDTSAGRHDALGLALVDYDEMIFNTLDHVLEGWSNADFNLIMSAIFGHHGRPIQRNPYAPPRNALCQISTEVARSFAAELLALLHPPSLPPPPKGWVANASWWLAGLTTLSDWIGSSQDWFPYAAGSSADLAEYWPIARANAASAVARSGLLPVSPGIASGLRGLMTADISPTPVQALAETMEMPDGPIIVVIEDATGGGKTEAALIVAQRLIASGRADGLFVALPTMATADAMFNRLAQSYRRLFAPEARPSLALAHGRAELNDLFQGSILPQAGEADDVSDDVGESASTQCTAWLAEERRRAFLAHVGVGTIDQALLGVLAAKHAALRLFGLARKVLVIDEAHSYDTYVSAELETLLRFHAMQGGHSIVLSATLPQSRRVALLKNASNREMELSSAAYPLVSVASAHAVREYPAELREVLRRDVKLRRLSAAEQAVDYLAHAARLGACGIWIRNTVDDVRAGSEALRSAGIEPVVFHARFAMGDRLAIQSNVLAWFGKHATAEMRAPGGLGRVLIGSQVLEQSLDLDADVMVSDLAPVDLLIQRAGRLRRHPERVRPVGLPECELLVVSPDPVAAPAADWAADSSIGGTRFVYPPHILWLSARVMFAAGVIAVPDGVRGLVEAVYGDVAEAVPEGLLRSESKDEGERIAQESAAWSNLLKPERGYSWDSGDWSPDIAMPTRLGDDYLVFRMAKEEAGRLVPWCSDADPKRAWALSEISLRRSLATGAVVPAHLAAAMEKLRARWPVWQRETPVLVLSKTSESGDSAIWSGCISGHDGNRDIMYAMTLGLA